MEVQGRECEEIEIGKHKCYFVSEYKGREYRLIQDIIFGGVKGGKFDITEGTFSANIPELFKVLCIRIDDGSVGVGVEFLDGLSIEDYIKVQEKVIESVTGFFTQVK